MSLKNKISVRLISGCLSFFLGSYIAYIAVKAFINREAFFTANSEYMITSGYFYQVLGFTSLVALLLIGIPTYFYFKKK